MSGKKRTCGKCLSDNISVTYRGKYYKFKSDTEKDTNLSSFDIRRFSEGNTWYECRDELLDCTCLTCGYRWFTYVEDHKE